MNRPRDDIDRASCGAPQSRFSPNYESNLHQGRAKCHHYWEKLWPDTVGSKFLTTGNAAGRDDSHERMTFLKKLMTGQIALWCVFWLIGIPLAVLWDASGLCTVVGCGIQDPAIGGLLLGFFAVSSVAIPFVSFAIWRSSSKYPQKTWPQVGLALGAKLCAVLSALLALIGLAVLLYIAYYMFIYPALNSG